MEHGKPPTPRNSSSTFLDIFHKFDPPKVAWTLQYCILNPIGIPTLVEPLHKLGLDPIGFSKLVAHLSVTLKRIFALLF